MHVLPLQPNARQVRTWVAERLRSGILEGIYPPGEWLRQQRLAEDLGVSQMPVREALKELAAEGLVEHVPYRGVRVVSFSTDDVADLYAHRAMLEGVAAAAAAIMITSDELNALHKIQEEMETRYAPQDLQAYRSLNRRFHEGVFRASRRNYLIRTLNQMWETFPTMLASNFPSTADAPVPKRDDIDRQEHRSILNALEAHDPEAAQAAMHSHIMSACQELVAVLKDKA